MPSFGSTQTVIKWSQIKTKKPSMFDFFNMEMIIVIFKSLQEPSKMKMNIWKFIVWQIYTEEGILQEECEEEDWKWRNWAVESRNYAVVTYKLSAS